MVMMKAAVFVEPGRFTLCTVSAGNLSLTQNALNLLEEALVS